MAKTSYKELLTPEIVDLFLTGKVEEWWLSGSKRSIDIGNQLWNKMSTINDIRSLFFSELESCQYWATYVVDEDFYWDRTAMDLTVMLSTSRYSSVRYNVCSSFWDGWHVDYIDALIRFIHDDDRLVRSAAITFLDRLSIEDLRVLKIRIESGNHVCDEAANVIKRSYTSRLVAAST